MTWLLAVLLCLMSVAFLVAAFARWPSPEERRRRRDFEALKRYYEATTRSPEERVRDSM